MASQERNAPIRKSGEASVRDWLQTEDGKQAKKILKAFGEHCRSEKPREKD